jgi:hypothetical protein
MVRSNASPVLGTGQSRLSHPPTQAKFPNRRESQASRGGAGSALYSVEPDEDLVLMVRQRKAGTKSKMKRIALKKA